MLPKLKVNLTTTTTKKFESQLVFLHTICSTLTFQAKFSERLILSLEKVKLFYLNSKENACTCGLVLTTSMQPLILFSQTKIAFPCHQGLEENKLMCPLHHQPPSSLLNKGWFGLSFTLSPACWDSYLLITKGSHNMAFQQCQVHKSGCVLDICLTESFLCELKDCQF